MSKNLMPQIAEMLGIELGEEFKVEGDKDFEQKTFYLTARGLKVKLAQCPEKEIPAMAVLDSLLFGDTKIIKLPWKPKKDHVYYSFYVDWKDDGENYMWKVTKYFWTDSFLDFAAFKAGWVFRTREEAKAALPSVAKESGMKYEL